jgi:putative endonuclease|nr:GIY-YIG nuclease family protein [Lachnoclostridium sp. An76]
MDRGKYKCQRAEEVRKVNYTYIVRCSDGTLYTGWTNDLDKRIRDHNEGRGAKYTRSRRPVILAYYEEFLTKEEAMSREWAIKHMPRAKKEEMIRRSGAAADIP